MDSLVDLIGQTRNSDPALLGHRCLSACGDRNPPRISLAPLFILNPYRRCSSEPPIARACCGFSANDIFKIRANCCVLLSIVMGSVAGDGDGGTVRADEPQQVLAMAANPEPPPSEAKAAGTHARPLRGLTTPCFSPSLRI